jgi:hypothetical protein
MPEQKSGYLPIKIFFENPIPRTFLERKMGAGTALGAQSVIEQHQQQTNSDLCSF